MLSIYIFSIVPHHKQNLFLVLHDLFLLVKYDWGIVSYSSTIMHQRLISRCINWLCYHGSLYSCILWELLLLSEASLSLAFLFLKHWLIVWSCRFHFISVFWGLERLFLIQSLISNPPTVYILLELFICTLKLEENKQRRWNTVLPSWFLSADMLLPSNL